MERNEAINWLLEMYKNTKMPSSYMDPNRDKKGEALKIAINSLKVDEAYQLEYEEMTGKEETEAHDINVETIGDMSPKEALKYIWNFINTTNFNASDTTLFNLGRAIGTLDVAIYNKEDENETNNNN